MNVFFRFGSTKKFVDIAKRHMKTGIVISNKARWLAITTGVVTAVTGLPVLSFLPALLSVSLILGALLAGRSSRYGRDLLWFGAGITSIWVIPIGLLMLHGAFTRSATDPKVTVAAAVSILLVILCDATLIREAFGQELRING